MSMQGDNYGPNYRLVLIPSPFLENERKQIYIRRAIFHTHDCCMQNFAGLDVVEEGKRQGEMYKREKTPRVGFMNKPGPDSKQEERQDVETLRSARVIWLLY